jgi:hypothetical protein
VSGRRVVAAAVLVILNLLAFYCVAVSWLLRPGGSWDRDAAAGLAALALVGAVITLPTTVLTIIPVGLRWLKAWWLIIPVVLLVLAVARIAYLGMVYPSPSDNYGLRAVMTG